MAKTKTEKSLKERMEAVAKKAKKDAQKRAERRRKAASAPPAAYRPAIVTFIDILGFKEIVKTRSADEIHKILAELREWSAGDGQDDDDRDDADVGLARSIAFSDNVVRVCPVDGEHGYSALFHELMSLVYVQAKLTERGVFLRGGVTVADIYMSGGEVFGPGLVRAYELESNMAIYPRIVIDPVVLESYFETPAMQGFYDLDEDLRAISELLRQGEDGLYFVDYLKACRSELRDPGVGFNAKLKQHAGYIQTAAEEFKSFSSAKQKYAWLARYHNQVVDETEDADEDCKVDTAAIAFPNLTKKGETPTDAATSAKSATKTPAPARKKSSNTARPKGKR